MIPQTEATIQPIGGDHGSGIPGRACTSAWSARAEHHAANEIIHVYRQLLYITSIRIERKNSAVLRLKISKSRGV